MNDRSYYRALPVRALIEAGTNSDDELTIALAERLDDVQHELEVADRDEIRALEQENGSLRDEVDELRRDNRFYEHEINVLNDEIERLQNQLNNGSK